MSDLSRFYEHVELIPFHECWEWRGALDKDGYGYFWEKNKTSRAHKFAITLKEPRIPGMVIDHICRNRACVNPAHLRQVTSRHNVLFNSSGLAAKNKMKTCCHRGHPFNAQNTGIDKLGNRYCKKCCCLNSMRHYWKKRDARNKNSASA